MLSSAFADGPFPRGHSRSAMKLSRIFRVHGIAPSRNRTKAPRSPVPRHANFSSTLPVATPLRGQPFSARSFAQRHENYSKTSMSTASRHLATAPKHRIRQPPSTSQTCFPPLSRTALLRADTRASPRVILNLPQARHMPPRRLVMPTAAGRRRFHWRPFPASRIPAPTPKRRMRQPTANFSNTVSVATPLRGQPLSAQTYAPRHGTPLKSPWPR